MRIGDKVELNGKEWVAVSSGRVEVPVVRAEWEKRGFDADLFFNLRLVGPQLATQPYEIHAMARKHNKTGRFSIAPR